MRYKTLRCFIFLLTSCCLSAQSQDPLENSTAFPSGIFLGYGPGAYAVKDAYISEQRYAGSMPCYSLAWQRNQGNRGYRLAFDYWKTLSITNHHVSAEAQQFSFSQDYLFPAGSFGLFSGRVNVRLGPSVQFFYYEIYYHFAQPGTFISPLAHGLMGSLGVNAELSCGIRKGLGASASLRSNLLALTGKELDAEHYVNEPSPALLTAATATKIDLDAFLRYDIGRKMAVLAGYRFVLSRINKWDPYIAAGSNFMIALNLKI